MSSLTVINNQELITKARQTLSAAVSEARSNANHQTTGGTETIESSASRKVKPRADFRQDNSNGQLSGRQRTLTGIRVSLNQISQDPEIDSYTQLRSDGRRKTINSPDQLNTTITKSAREVSSTGIEQARSASRSGPQSRIILDGFIEQMLGIERPPIPGEIVNTTV